MHLCPGGVLRYLPDKYPKRVQDENYYTELWIPVKKSGKIIML